MRTSAGPAASADLSTNIAANSTADPPSDAETEPLPFSDDEGRITTKGVDMDTSGAEALQAADDAAQAAAALVESATGATHLHIQDQDAAEEDSISDSDLSDAPDEGDNEADGSNDEDEEEEEEDDEGELTADKTIAATEAEAEASSLSDDSADGDGESDSDEANDEDEGDDVAEGQEGEDDSDDDDEEEEEEGEEGAGADAVNAPASVDPVQDSSGATVRAGGRRARQERANVLSTAQEEEDEEDAASSLAALAGGASQIDRGVEEEDADTDAAEASDTVAEHLVSTGNSIAAAVSRTRKPSLLGQQLLVEPDPEDDGTSRQPSAEAEGDDDDDDDGDYAKVKAVEADTLAKEDAAAEVDGEPVKEEVGLVATETETAADTPMPDAPEQEDEPTTDEAAVRRQEAMDALTKIEIGFALLRDRLYVERIDEVSKEGEMILDGSHPELIHLTALIEARRQHRLRMVELWFGEEQRHHAKMAAAEEREAWLTWRHGAADLRRDSMDQISKKRRKLEREKRNLDAPRPARRHHVFETELIGDPELAAAAAQASKLDREKGAAGRRRAAREAEELAKLGSHIALPDLRGLEDFEAWSDLERMGILRPDMRLMQTQQVPPPNVSLPPGASAGRSTPPHAPLGQGHHHMLPQVMPHPQEAEMAFYAGGPGRSPHPGWPGEHAMDGYHGQVSNAAVAAHGPPDMASRSVPHDVYAHDAYGGDGYPAEASMMYGGPGMGQQPYRRYASPPPPMHHSYESRNDVHHPAEAPSPAMRHAHGRASSTLAPIQPPPIQQQQRQSADYVRDGSAAAPPRRQRPGSVQRDEREIKPAHNGHLKHAHEQGEGRPPRDHRTVSPHRRQDGILNPSPPRQGHRREPSPRPYGHDQGGYRNSPSAPHAGASMAMHADRSHSNRTTASKASAVGHGSVIVEPTALAHERRHQPYSSTESTSGSSAPTGTGELRVKPTPALGVPADTDANQGNASNGAVREEAGLSRSSSPRAQGGDVSTSEKKMEPFRGNGDGIASSSQSHPHVPKTEPLEIAHRLPFSPEVQQRVASMNPAATEGNGSASRPADADRAERME